MCHPTRCKRRRELFPPASACGQKQLMLRLVVVAATAALLFFVIVVVTAAALAFVMMVMMSAAAAFTFLVVMVAAATAFLMIVVMPAAAAFAFAVMVVMTAATAAAFLVIMVMPAAAALAFAMMMVMTAATAFAFLVVMVVTAAALIFIMVVVMSAASTAAPACRFAELNRIKGFLGFRHFETHHLKHLGEVGERKDGEAFVNLSQTNAAVDERACCFAENVEVARDVEHLLNGRTNSPESTGFINEEIIDLKRTKISSSHAHRHIARRGMDGLRELRALSGGEGKRMSLVKESLRGSSLRGKKLGKRRHGNTVLKYQSSRSFSEAARTRTKKLVYCTKRNGRPASIFRSEAFAHALRKNCRQRIRKTVDRNNLEPFNRLLGRIGARNERL